MFDRYIGLYLGVPRDKLEHTLSQYAQSEAGDKQQVIVRFIDQEREFTFEEFFKLLGFEFDEYTKASWDASGVPLTRDVDERPGTIYPVKSEMWERRGPANNEH